MYAGNVSFVERCFRATIFFGKIFQLLAERNEISERNFVPTRFAIPMESLEMEYFDKYSA